MEVNFESMDEAFEFYRSYAQLAGFNVKKNRTRNGRRAQDFHCSFEGKKRNSPGPNRKRARTTMKTGCKAMVRAMKARDGARTYFTRIVLEHNHKLTRTPKMTNRMRAHKLKDPAMEKIIETMHRAKVKHVNVMSVLKQSVGGSENLNMTERDVQNR